MNNYVDNFYHLLTASVLATILVASMLLKYFDRRFVLSWLRDKTKEARFGIAVFGFWLIVALELIALCAVVVAGTYGSHLSGVFAILFWCAALIGAVTFRQTGGCPCFGAAGIISPLFNSVTIFSVCIVATFVLSLLQAYVQASPLVVVVSMTSIGVGSFIFGRGITLSPYNGSWIRNDLRYLIDPVRQEVGDQLVIFVFLKINCPSCMILLRYIEKVSSLFCRKFRFVLSIDGLGNTEAVKLSEAFIIPAETKIEKGIVRVTPSVIVPEQTGYRVFGGLNPCSLALAKVINSFLVIPKEKG